VSAGSFQDGGLVIKGTDKQEMGCIPKTHDQEVVSGTINLLPETGIDKPVIGIQGLETRNYIL